MAKKQVFGADALQAKMSARRMAKVVISTKNENGKYSYREAMVDQDNVKDFIQSNKA